MNYSTQDKKIMEFDVKKGFDEFIKIFTDEEVDDMYNWLSNHYYGEISRETIVLKYVQEWLIENIRNLRYRGTEELFNILFKS